MNDSPAGSRRGPIRVLHVASGDLWAGAESMLWHLVSAQCRSEAVYPAVALLNEGELARRLRARGIEPYILDEQRYAAAKVFGGLLSLIEVARPDLVHTHRCKENVLGGIAALLRRTPSLRTIHGIEEHPARLGEIRRWMAQWIDHTIAVTAQSSVVAVCHALAASLPHRLRGKTCVIHNGIDVSSIDSSVHAERVSDMIRIGFVGRLTRVKRVDRFLHIARALSERVPGRFEFVVAGHGPLLEQTRRHTTELGLSRVVHFLGFVADIPPLLKSLDALFVTSDNEGIPYNVLEAHALGVPVIASSVGGLPEALDGGSAGVLVSPDDVEGFVAAGATLATRPERFLPLLERAGTIVREQFSNDGMAAAYARLYQAIISRRS